LQRDLDDDPQKELIEEPLYFVIGKLAVASRASHAAMAIYQQT
jgi:hypothetical protein